jgi:hypothetical protein
MNKLPTSIILLAALTIGACASKPEPKPEPAQFPPIRQNQILDSNGNFTLGISNQSFAIPTVDISVSIDGVLIVSEDFPVKNQHFQRIYSLKLDPGPHKIHITTKAGDATLTKDFTLKDEKAATVTYWYYPDTHYEPTPKHLAFGLHKSWIGMD